MYDFLSWIEVRREGEPHLCYLTDTEVFSDHGKETLKDSKGNDFLGHGAIRAFYNLAKGEGTEHEEKNFWKANLPKEIAEKIKDFDKHWGRMLSSKVFPNDDLCHIICYAPKEWKEKAWTQLLKQKPSNDDLCHISHIICYAPTEWKEKAWTQLLKQKPSNDDLCYIIEYAPKEWKEKARTLLNSRK